MRSRKTKLWLCKLYLRIIMRWSDFLYRIESMKMETIIRSPQKGKIAKLVHKEGVRIVVLL